MNRFPSMSKLAEFETISRRLIDKGMGTENVAPLLYSLVKMQRPHISLAVGLGYSTLHILKALAENQNEFQYDMDVMQGNVTDPGRREVLYEDYFDDDHIGQPPILLGIDNFSENGPHLDKLQTCVADMGLEAFLKLHQMDFQAFDAESVLEDELIDFIWLDCGHQLDYPALINKFWPLLEPDGGVMAIHYTHVDIDMDYDGDVHKLMITGAVANAIKKQQLTKQMSSRFEYISLLEPHKFRQGSVSLIRRLDESDVCRDTEMNNELNALYGSPGEPLIDLNQS